MQSCDIIFVAERFLIRLSILCNFIVASVKLTLKYLKTFPVESSDGTAPRFIEAVSHIIVSLKKTMTYYLFDVLYECIQRSAISN